MFNDNQKSFHLSGFMANCQSIRNNSIQGWSWGGSYPGGLTTIFSLCQLEDQVWKPMCLCYFHLQASVYIFQPNHWCTVYKRVCRVTPYITIQHKNTIVWGDFNFHVNDSMDVNANIFHDIMVAAVFDQWVGKATDTHSLLDIDGFEELVSEFFGSL